MPIRKDEVRSSAASTRDSRSARVSTATERSLWTTSKGSIEKRLLVLKFLLATLIRCAIASSSWRLTRDVQKSWSDKLRVAWTQSDVKSATCNCAACKKHEHLRYKLLELSEAAAKQEVSIHRKKLSDNHTWWLTQLNTTVWKLAKLVSHGFDKYFCHSDLSGFIHLFENWKRAWFAGYWG